MKAINCPLRQATPDDIGWGSSQKPRTRAAFKKIARRQLRAAERQLFLRETILTQRDLVAEQRRQAAEERRSLDERAKVLTKLLRKAISDNARAAAAATKALRKMYDDIERELDTDVEHAWPVPGRIAVCQEVTVISGQTTRTLPIRASCAID